MLRVLKAGKTYEEVYNSFRWQVPEYYNIGVDICDKWANEKYRLALICLDQEGKERKVTFWELKNFSNQLANALKVNGIDKGDRVGILLSQSPETLISHIALYKVGGIAVPLMILFGIDALEHRLENSEAKGVITDRENLPKILEIKDALPNLRMVMVVDSEGERGVLDFWSTVEKGSRCFTPASTKADDPAIIIYTSGTTGPPKGTLLPHKTLIGHLPAVEFGHEFFPKKGDFFWTPFDWAYIGGLFDVLFPSLYYGIPILGYRARKFDPEKTLYLIGKYGVRNTLMVPTALNMIRQAVEEPQKRYDIQLRSIMAGGETVGKELVEWSRYALGTGINEAYGQTECNLVVGNCSEVMEVIAGSMGKAIPGHIVETIDENGEVVKPGEFGEIAVKRPDPVMFLEYWRNPEATNEKYIGDWLRTGDYGTKDKNGYFWFTGRQDDVIESGAYRIGPGEVEDCLMKHQAVALAAVVGVSDKIRGQIVKAFIIPKEGVKADKALEDSIKQHVKTRLERHAYPREIDFVKELPMTSTGKIMRKELRRMDMERKTEDKTRVSSNSR